MATKRTALRTFIDEAQLVMDYHNAIGQGIFTEHTPFRGFGDRTALSTVATGDDVWSGTTTTVPIPAAAGEQMTLVSTSANDTVAGSGVRTVDVHGLDTNGNPQTEVVPMNGTTPVNTVRTDWRFIQGIHTNSIGIPYTAAQGVITIYKTGFAATVYNQISIGGNVSVNSARMIPNGKTFYLRGGHASAGSNKPVAIRLRATSTLEDDLCDFFQFKDLFLLIDSALPFEYVVPLKFPPLCIIKATAYSTTAGGDTSFSYRGWYE